MSVSGACNNCMILSNGTFHVSGSSTPIYIDVINENNQNLNDCVKIVSEVFKTFPSLDEYDDCGCLITDCNRASLRINISKSTTQTTDCGFNGFSLDDSGLILFEMYDNSTTYFMDSECCTSLGYTPELDKGIFVCRWKAKTDECSGYRAMKLDSDDIMVYIGPSGEMTKEVPKAECCSSELTSELLANGKYRCKSKRVVPDNTIKPLFFNEDDWVVWNVNGERTQYTPTGEICHSLGFQPISEVYGYRCKVVCQLYSNIKYSMDNMAIFYRNDESFFSDVPLIECCPRGTLARPTVGPYGLTYYKCYKT